MNVFRMKLFVNKRLYQLNKKINEKKAFINGFFLEDVKNTSSSSESDKVESELY